MTAHFEDGRQFGAPLPDILLAMEIALSEIGATAVSWSDDRLWVSAKMWASWSSAGERLNICVDATGAITVSSVCSAFQIFDWGKNARNCRYFLESVANALSDKKRAAVSCQATESHDTPNDDRIQMFPGPAAAKSSCRPILIGLQAARFLDRENSNDSTTRRICDFFEVDASDCKAPPRTAAEQRKWLAMLKKHRPADYAWYLEQQKLRKKPKDGPVDSAQPPTD